MTGEISRFFFAKVSINGTDYDLTQAVLEGFHPIYCYNKQAVPHLNQMAECLAEKYFVWGFSSLMIYIIASIQIIWTLGTYIIWLDAHTHSALCRSGRGIRGPFRPAADLSEAMTEVLGSDICAYSDKELSQALRAESGLRYYADDGLKRDVSHIGVSSRRTGRVPFRSTKVYGRYTKILWHNRHFE